MTHPMPETVPTRTGIRRLQLRMVEGIHIRATVDKRHRERKSQRGRNTETTPKEPGISGITATGGCPEIVTSRAFARSSYESVVRPAPTSIPRWSPPFQPPRVRTVRITGNVARPSIDPAESEVSWTQPPRALVLLSAKPLVPCCDRYSPLTHAGLGTSPTTDSRLRMSGLFWPGYAPHSPLVLAASVWSNYCPHLSVDIPSGFFYSSSASSPQPPRIEGGQQMNALCALTSRSRLPGCHDYLQSEWR